MRFILIGVEALLVALLVLAAIARPRVLIRATEPFSVALDRMARFRVASILLCAALPLTIRILIMPTLGIRAPKTQDEFAQLLQADAFARGRLTTPAPSLSRHFESVHVSVEPTYFSKYPPARAAILAIGQRYFGHPWWGAWLGIGLMCIAICWMLYQWLPPRWALLGGLLVAAKLGIFSYWMNSYWGGSLSAAAGALVLGSARHVLRSRRSDPPKARYVALMMFGGMLLANSRPYEGVLLCGTVGGLVALSLLRAGTSPHVLVTRVLLPAVLVIVPAAALMARYNTALTGSPTHIPYAVNSAQYRMAGQFIWSPPKPTRAYRHPQLQRFYERERETQLSKRSLGAVPRHVVALVLKIWLFYVAPALTLLLLVMPRLLRDKRTRPLLVVGIVVGVGLVANAFFIPHYAAPMAAVIVALAVQGLRHLHHLRWRGAPVGMALARGIPVVIILTIVARLALPTKLMADVPEYPLTWYWTDPGGTERAWILETFEERPGFHLLFVKYDESASPHTEWVYNSANLKSQTVVWARAMSEEEDAELIAQFPDRTPWLFLVSATGNEIYEYNPLGASVRRQRDASRSAALGEARSNSATERRTPSSMSQGGTQSINDRNRPTDGGS